MSATPAPAPTPAWRLIVTLGATALIAGVLVVGAYELTLPRIQENQQRALQAALRQVVPGAASFRQFALGAEGLGPAGTAAGGRVIHAGYDADGRLRALAIEAVARGYQDKLQLLYAYAPDCQCITAIHVLRSTETPGIGDKISTDRSFLENFRALDARLAADGRSLANDIVTVPRGSKVAAWQIDAISGATVTSRAVGRALNDSAQAVLPQVVPRLERLRRPPETR